MLEAMMGGISANRYVLQASLAGLRVLDASTMQPIKYYISSTSSLCTMVTTSPDKSIVIGVFSDGTYNNTIVLYSISQGNLTVVTEIDIKQILGAQANARFVCLSNNNQRIYITNGFGTSSSASPYRVVIDVDSKAIIYNVAAPGNVGQNASCAISADGHYLLDWNANTVTRKVNVDTGQITNLFTQSNRSYFSFQTHPITGTMIALWYNPSSPTTNGIFIVDPGTLSNTTSFRNQTDLNVESTDRLEYTSGVQGFEIDGLSAIYLSLDKMWKWSGLYSDDIIPHTENQIQTAPVRNISDFKNLSCYGPDGLSWMRWQGFLNGEYAYTDKIKGSDNPYFMIPSYATAPNWVSGEQLFTPNVSSSSVLVQARQAACLII
ncbi:hypothetical protein ACGLWX_05845 [Halomonas sp. HMF6819]|uniref:hypothetical protein n=1 Tax=Halomonas sp. HMF6819 TaxID=3373085 RepID=UPI00379396C3